MTRNRSVRRRKTTGALAAEYVATMWLLFIFLFFPILNFGCVGLNAFFLWFACNCAATVGAKAQCFQQAVQIPAGTGTWYPGGYNTARAKATEIKNVFHGIQWTENDTNPEVAVIAEPIDPSDTTLSRHVHIGPGAWVLSGGFRPDPDQYTLLFRVTIEGTAAPLIAVPWFDVPGLSRPMPLKVNSQAQWENPPGLTF